MRYAEYIFAAIGIVLIGVLAVRSIPDRQPVTEPPPPSPTPTFEERFRPNASRLMDLISTQEQESDRIEGQVVTETGAPIANAIVKASSEHGEVETVLSTMNGSFSLKVPRPGNQISFQVTANGFASTPIEPLEAIPLTNGSLEGVQIILGAESAVFGIVVDGAGNPVPAVNLYLYSTADPTWEKRVNLNDDATFTIRGLEAGQYHFRFYYRGPYTPAPAGDREFAIKQGEKLSGLEIVIPGSLTNHLISGIVVNDRDQAVGNAEIYDSNLQHIVAETNETGQFWAHINSFPTTVLAKHSEYSMSESHSLDGPGGDHRLILRPPAIVSGRVVFDDTGEPVRTFKIAKSRFETNDGRFSNVRLSAGSRSILVSVHGYPLSITPIAPLEVGEHRYVELRVRPGTQFEGRVLDADGRPVRLARVEIDNSRYHGIPREGGTDTTNDDGGFLLGPVHEGPVEIRVHPPKQIEETFSVNVSPSMPIAVLRLARRYSLRIEVTNQSSLRVVSQDREESSIDPFLGVILFKGADVPAKVSSATDYGMNPSVAGIRVVRNGAAHFGNMLESGSYTAVIATGNFVGGQSFSGVELTRQMVEIPANSRNIITIRVTL